MFERHYQELGNEMRDGRVLILYGPRRVGKTTLLKNYLEVCGLRYKLDSGENLRTAEVLSSQDIRQIQDYCAGYELIAIDEAQYIPEIGAGLKIIVDHIPEVKVIVTGSSSFDLAQKTGEPLTGRRRTITLFPLAQKELAKRYNRHELKERLEEYLLFGGYPAVAVAATRADKIEVLRELTESYLLKDILALDRIRSPRALLDLLKLLAFQVGSQVSLSELATQLSIDAKTVGRYLDLLEKVFVVRRLPGFSRNLRNEVTGKAKYYFWDNGVRNALISNFNRLADRDDKGALFENLVVCERLKKLAYENFYGEVRFWRTYEGQEIDLIEEVDGQLDGIEIKYKKEQTRPPKEWAGAYPQASWRSVTTENYLDFVL
ncbi:MAG TPA: ATP-binding protein [bacterium]|nr:ATP-binding protein [bacterium]